MLLIVLAALAVGGVAGRQWWQARTVRRDLALARQHLDQGKPEMAEQILATRMETSKPTSAWSAALVDLRFEALEAMNDVTAEQMLAGQVLDEQRPWVRSGEPAWARAEIIQGRVALKAQQIDQARQHFLRVLGQPQGAQGQAEAELGLARIEMAIGKVPEAKARLDAMLETLAENHPVRAGVEHNLGLINTTMLLSREPFGEDEIYAVTKGDSIYKIARRFEVSQDLIMRVNQISDPSRLSIGRRLKIPRLDLSIVVDKSNNTLTLYNQGKFFKKYQVRTGEYDYQTPVGDFEVRTKKKDPAWTSPQTGKHYAAGDPENQLGTRWMGFSGNASLGIHEAVDESSIGTYSSNGCVGLARADVEELYDLMRRGAPVKIVGEKATPALKL